MEDYFINESQWPDKEVRVALARRVNAVLQCYCYSAYHVYIRFAKLRRQAKVPATSRPKPRSLSPNAQRKEGTETRAGGADHKSVVAKLDVLLEDEPSPTPEVAAIWADVLAEGVTPADILTYALLRQVKRHMAGSQDVRQEHAATSFVRLPQTGSSPRSVKQRRKGGPLKRIKHPEVMSSSLSLFPEDPSSHLEEGGGDSPRKAGSLPSSTSPACVTVLPIETQVLAAQIRHSLSSAPPGPQPATFSDLCTWIRGSASATAL